MEDKHQSNENNSDYKASNNSNNQPGLYQTNKFFDYNTVLKSETAQVTKKWYLHPYTGVGPHSVSFSQSLTNKDIVNMYTQSGNYFYHSNCYSGSLWTASSFYYQYDDPQVTKQVVKESVSSKEPDSLEKIAQTVENEIVDEFNFLKVNKNARIYYQNISHIPPIVYKNLDSTTLGILQNSPKHRLTIGGRLVLPKEWKNMTPFDISRWGKNSTSKINSELSANAEIDLNKAIMWPVSTVDGTNTVTAPKWTRLPDSSAYYRADAIPSKEVPEAFNIKIIPYPTFQGAIDCADTVPVRSVIRSYSMLPADIESNRPIPTTNVYSQFLEKINKDTPDDAFRSMISRPAITDADARIWIAHNLTQLKYGSYMDVVPQTTALLILHSLTKDRHFVDPIIFRTIRNKSIKAFEKGVSISRREISEVPSLMVVTSHLSHFIKYMARVVPVHTDFDPNMLDIDWIVVPVTTSVLSNPSRLGAYVMCHLSSEYWNGTVTWMKKSAYGIPEKYVPPTTVDKQRCGWGCEYFMPASNSVYIPGVNKVWLVVVPSTSEAQASISMFSTQIPNSPDSKTKKLNPKEINTAWREYWQGNLDNNIPEIISDFYWALSVLSMTSTTPDSTRRAMGLATELSNVSYPGVRIKTSPGASPSLQGGAWTYGGTKVFKNAYDSKDWADGGLPAKNSSPDRKKRIAGFSFSSVSPSIQHASSYAMLTQNMFMHKYYDSSRIERQLYAVDKISQRWVSTKPEFNTPQYIANQATSICRLAAAIGLLETGGGSEYNFMNSPAVQQFITHNGAAMFGNVSSMLIQNDISPWLWIGYGHTDHPQYQDAYRNLFKQLFHSTINVVNISNLQISGVEYDWSNMVDYYSTDQNDQETWMQHVPVPVANYLQWNQKLEIYSSPNTENINIYRLMGEENYGLRITHQNCDLKTKLFLMINDRKTAWPMVRVFDSFEDKPYYDSMWMDNYYYLSSALIDPGVSLITKADSNSYLQSNTYARSLSPGVLGYESETVMIITAGLGLSRNSEQSIPHVTPICLPDPPNAKTFLEQKIEKVGEKEVPVIMSPDPVPTQEEVKHTTDAVTPVTTTITQS